MVIITCKGCLAYLVRHCINCVHYSEVLRDMSSLGRSNMCRMGFYTWIDTLGGRHSRCYAKDCPFYKRRKHKKIKLLSISWK